MRERWEVEYSAEFEVWWNSLEEPIQEAIAHDIGVLEQIGPLLGRPHVDTIAGSRHANMKELRTRYAGHQYRTLFAFDPRRTAILLIAGDKTNDKRFYKTAIARADDVYERHLAVLRKQGLIS